MNTGSEVKELFELPEAETGPERFVRRRNRLQQRIDSAVESFLGSGEKAEAVVIQPVYYGELLTWALHQYIKAERWRIIKTLGYHGPEPVYIGVNTGPGKYQNLLLDGLLFLERGKNRLVIVFDINLRAYSSLVVNGSAHKQEQVSAFADGVLNVVEEQNFYRGGKLQYGGRIRFLNLPAESWGSLIIDKEIKDEIWTNTVGFLGDRKHLSCYGIPAKRGVLLVGEPGTGKTLVCKALMAESGSITCITTNACFLDVDEYITDLYKLAQDLAPCIVFIEDIDLIAQNRMEWGYHKGSALVSLLSVLDGVEEYREIVTVATTNYLEVLDKAVGQRPSRFDRVIHLSCPSLEQRRELVSFFCRKIPVHNETQTYIAQKTAHCTPAQLQEVIYSLVIRHSQNDYGGGKDPIQFSYGDINSTISRITGSNKSRIGFAMSHDQDNKCIMATGTQN